MPTHQIEGEDYAAGSGALAGERVHKDAVPATAWRQYQANALWHGLRGIVKDEQVSGDLTAASGSADQAAGYVLLGKALRRMARRFKSAEVQSVVATSAGYTFTPAPDKFVYMIDNDGSGPYGDGSAIYPDTTDPTSNDYRFILCINISADAKVIGDSASGKMARLLPGESCFFYGMPDSGSTLWVPVGMPLDDSAAGYQGFDVRLYDGGASATHSDPFKAAYVKHGPGRNLVTINFGESRVTTTTSASAVQIANSVFGSGYFPPDLVPIGIGPTENSVGSFGTNGPVTIVSGSIDGVQAMFAVYFTSGGADIDTTTLLAFPLGGASLGVGKAVILSSFSMTHLTHR